MKRLLPLAAFCLVSAIAVIIAAQTLISPDLVTRRLVGEIESWTGWTVTVSGRTEVAFFPVPSFTVTGITVAGAGAGAGAAPLAEVAVVKGKFKVLPLLIGRIEAREVQLVEPSIRLTIDREGRRNWELGEGQAKIATTGRASPKSTAAADQVRPGGVSIVDGRLTFIDEAAGVATAAIDIDLSSTKEFLVAFKLIKCQIYSLGVYCFNLIQLLIKMMTVREGK